MKLHIRGGHLIDPSQGMDQKGDVWVQDGKIAALFRPGENPPEKPDRTIDAEGAFVAPGFIDLHVHFREPGQEEKEDIESGSKAAVVGGFTSVLCMPNTNPVNDSAQVTQRILQRAKEVALCRIYPVGAVTKGLESRELAPLRELKIAGCVAFSDDGRPVANLRLMREALEIAKSLNTPLIEHCEELSLSTGPTVATGKTAKSMGFAGVPVSAETTDLSRTVMMAAEVGARLHLAHLSAQASVDLVREYKGKMTTLTAEATPHHLILTEEAVATHGTNAKMYPPLRSDADRAALVAGVCDGTIDVIATDHAPHTASEKKRAFPEAPNGVIGLESALVVLLTLVKAGKLTLSQLVQKLSTAPAQIAGIEGGSLRVGSNADIVVFDSSSERTLNVSDFHSKSQNSPFVGFRACGRVLHTFVEGREAYSCEKR